MRAQIQRQFGWHFLAKEVAEYTGCTFFEVMEKRSALEVLGVTMLIQAKIEMEKLKGHA